ncbi:MAG: glycosyltransferase [Ferruginibacter sp.]
MKIVWLAHEANMSGANICLLEYLDILKSKGVDNYLVVPFGKGDLPAKAAMLGISVKIIKYYSWAQPMHVSGKKHIYSFRKKIRNFFAVKQIASVIKEWRPEYFATNTITTVVGAIAARKTNTKHIWFVHEFGEEDHGFVIAGNFKKGAGLINSLSNKIVFNSYAVSRKYLDIVPDQKSFIVDNPVLIKNVPLNTKDKPAIFSLVMLGQMAASKNHKEAILAIELCRQQGIDCCLEIIGKAENKSYEEELKHLIKSKALETVIHFSGQVEHPETFLLHHHALLMCSNKEAFGRVTVEALKCGLPVIAANTGGSLEIIKDGDNGYLYEAGNPSSLAEKIILLKQNYIEFDKQVIASNAMDKYNVKNTGDQLMKVFKNNQS